MDKKPNRFLKNLSEFPFIFNFLEKIGIIEKDWNESFKKRTENAYLKAQKILNELNEKNEIIMEKEEIQKQQQIIRAKQKEINIKKAENIIEKIQNKYEKN